MTKLNKQECNTETCLVCDSYNTLIALLAEGLTLEDAFVDVIQDVLMSVNDEMYGEGYKTGFTDGVLDAFTGIREKADNVIKAITEEDTCDCDGCCEGE